jgi:N-dimethylarginine dimethylaminohydrolase
VLLHQPGPELGESQDFDKVNMLAPLKIDKAQAQHDALARAYQEAGVTVHYTKPSVLVRPNQMFMADLFFMTPEGAILARPASEARAGEERIAAQCLANLGVPILRSVRGRGTFEGADAMWLDPATVIVGRGLRTNQTGADQVANILKEMGVETIEVDLPIGAMHLMGILRIVDRDLAVAWPGRFGYRGLEALQERGYRVVLIPDEQEALHGSALNFVTLGPRRIVMPAGNPATQIFYEGLGITCRTVVVDELQKAAGAIGCLTGILQREPVLS